MTDLEAFHLCEPSPQRVPVLFQAGASTRGRYRTAYPEGDTLREKIYDPGQAWLQPDHPGAGYRKSTAN